MEEIFCLFHQKNNLVFPVGKRKAEDFSLTFNYGMRGKTNTWLLWWQGSGQAKRPWNSLDKLQSWMFSMALCPKYTLIRCYDHIICLRTKGCCFWTVFFLSGAMYLSSWLAIYQYRMEFWWWKERSQSKCWKVSETNGNCTSAKSALLWLFFSPFISNVCFL